MAKKAPALWSGLFFIGRIFLFPQEASKAFAELVIQTGIFVFTLSMLALSTVKVPYPTRSAAASGGSDLFIFAWVYDLMQMTALDVGRFIIDNAAVMGGNPLPDTAATAGNYSHLWVKCEQVAFKLTQVGWDRFLHAGWTKLPTMIGWLILTAPYLFVLIIFGALLVQTMFYFLAISTISPLLIAGLGWSKTRHYFKASLKVLLTAAFTIVFASVAMGYTASVIGFYLAGLLAKLATDSTIGIFDATEFWGLLIMGFISAMLHLAAPKLAANIAGASESAVGAAAATAAGAYGGSKLLSAGKRAVLGSPGTSGGQIGGAAGLTGGVAGMAAGGLRAAFSRVLK